MSSPGNSGLRITNSGWEHRGNVVKHRKYPTWMLNHEKRKRVLSEYQAYLRREPITAIAHKHGVSHAQVYHDIRMARQEIYFRFGNTILDITLEQVSKRDLIISELWRSLEEIRATPVSTFRTQAEVKVLEAIGDQEKAIEELVGLRARSGLTDVNYRTHQESAQEVVLKVIVPEEAPVISAVSTPEPIGNGHGSLHDYGPDTNGRYHVEPLEGNDYEGNGHYHGE